ncbi:MAG: pentapeptide repeat-containing protein [Actinomycetales bacterium]
MAKKPLTAAPRCDELRLENLAIGDADALQAHESYSGERFEEADLSDRDLSGISFSECEFVDLEANEVVVRSATWVDTRFEKLNAPIFTAPRTNLRDVVFEGSRLGSAEFYETRWSSVRFAHCRIGYLNLRGAHLEDVLFTDCRIDELDLGAATANRVSFENTHINTLELTRSTLTNFDLRGIELRQLGGVEHLKGATLNSHQLIELAPLFARNVGIVIDD